MGFYRKREGAVIGGVCIGIADKYSIDPLLIRIAALVLLFFKGGLLGAVYLVLWAVLPALDSNITIKEELADKVQELNLDANSTSKTLFLGGLFIVAGIFALFAFIFPFPFYIIYKIFISLIFVGIGIYFLITCRRK